MRKYKLLLLYLFMFSTSQAQDLIIKKNGEEIKSKVLEVALKIIKYKKFDNPNGPTFEILKSDVFIIKYENGTKDILNVIDNKTVEEESEEKDKTNLAFTSKHRSVTIAYGLSALFGGITGYGVGEKEMAIGPLLVSFDKALSDKFSIAFRPAAMFYQFSYTDYNYFTRRWSTQTSDVFFGGLQVRIDYHFATSKKLDPYVGFGGGVGYFFGRDDFSALKGTYPLYGGNFGIRSYGKGKNAFLVELGYDSYSYLKIGYVFGKHK
jgi:hypothetical protein